MPVESATVLFQKHRGEFRINDIWFMVGSRCNLRCIHCYVDSSPENNSLEQLTLSEVTLFLEEAARYGLRSTYFTGGEPFLNGEIIPMIRTALDYGEVTLLTNATSPIIRHLDALENISRNSNGRMILRVSMDHYVESRHDAIRGAGTFRQTINHTLRLCAGGARVIITATPEVFRGNKVPHDHVEQEFRKLFASCGAFVEVKILPSVLEMGAQTTRVDEPTNYEIVTDEILQQRGPHRDALMCFSGRSILKKNGECRVYPCPIIYEVPDYDLGASLEESFRRSVPLSHRACSQYCCLSASASCTN